MSSTLGAWRASGAPHQAPALLAHAAALSQGVTRLSCLHTHSSNERSLASSSKDKIASNARRNTSWTVHWRRVEQAHAHTLTGMPSSLSLAAVSVMVCSKGRNSTPRSFSTLEESNRVRAKNVPLRSERRMGARRRHTLAADHHCLATAVNRPVMQGARTHPILLLRRRRKPSSHHQTHAHLTMSRLRPTRGPMRRPSHLGITRRGRPILPGKSLDADVAASGQRQGHGAAMYLHTRTGGSGRARPMSFLTRRLQERLRATARPVVVSLMQAAHTQQGAQCRASTHLPFAVGVNAARACAAATSRTSTKVKPRGAATNASSSASGIMWGQTVTHGRPRAHHVTPRGRAEPRPPQMSRSSTPAHSLLRTCTSSERLPDAAILAMAGGPHTKPGLTVTCAAQA